jgi:hypothetical protein
MNIEMIERPRARASDPATSHAAAKKAERFASSHVGRILNVFMYFSGFNWTAHELTDMTDLTVVQIDRRLGEIPQIERTRENRDGFTVWRLKSEPCHFVEQGDKDRGALSGR